MVGTKKQPPKEVSIADLIGLVFAPSPADPDDSPQQPVQPTQITAVTPAEMTQIAALAETTCELYDKIQELVGGLTIELDAQKKELKAKMLSHGLKKVAVPGRPPVELAINTNKNSSKQSIIGVLGVADGTNLWNKLPLRSSESLKIPPKIVPEAEG